jgi:uncharacterized protein (TIGR00369 family)
MSDEKATEAGDATVERVRASFARQSMMRTLGAELVLVERGRVDIRMPFCAAAAQQNGYLHAAATAAIADSACGYASLTQMPPESEVLTIEFKINLLAPAAGAWFVASGRVVRPGRTITVASAEVFAHQGEGGAGKLIAIMMATTIRVDASARPTIAPAESQGES